MLSLARVFAFSFWSASCVVMALAPFNKWRHCKLPPEPGPCRARIRMFYFNARSGRCDVFMFGGCDGNQNRFRDETDCLAKCADQGGNRQTIYPPIPRQPTTTRALPQQLARLDPICREPAISDCERPFVGISRLFYYYEAKLGTCLPLRVCSRDPFSSPFRNRFRTPVECFEKCDPGSRPAVSVRRLPIQRATQPTPLSDIPPVTMGKSSTTLAASTTTLPKRPVQNNGLPGLSWITLKPHNGPHHNHQLYANVRAPLDMFRKASKCNGPIFQTHLASDDEECARLCSIYPIHGCGAFTMHNGRCYLKISCEAHILEDANSQSWRRLF